MIITIDGPGASGKSTVAEMLAKKLGFLHFDTGAMYRSFTWAAIEQKIDLDDSKQLNSLLDTFHFDIKLIDQVRHYFVNGVDVTDLIRQGEVTKLVSKAAAIGEVRERLVTIQQTIAKGMDAIFEGRDLGTVVFPKAEVKFFLIGDPQVRAKRRFEELKRKFPEKTKTLTLEETLQDIERRDLYDSTRKHSPLRQAEDAIVIDTSSLSIEEVVAEMLKHI